MLITTLVLYCLLASFGLRIYYHNRRLEVDEEHLEYDKAQRRKWLASLLLIFVTLNTPNELPRYIDWFQSRFSPWTFVPALLAVMVLWVIKESLYKREIMWHRYAPQGSPLRASPSHRPRLLASLAWNLIFWAFLLSVPWLPFRECLTKKCVPSLVAKGEGASANARE